MSYINPDDNIQSERIPAIPDVASQFIRLHHQQPITERDILSLVDRFPVFFKQLLSIINSDHFNLTTKVHSIHQAIELAG
ncbi:MAG TPA: HDOD domain-containing protein, partial [Pseudomonadales bacterium]